MSNVEALNRNVEDIGTWGVHSGKLGTELLASSHNCSAASVEDSLKVICALAAEDYNDFCNHEEPVLDEQSVQRLIDRAEQLHTKGVKDDKIVLQPEDLAELVGPDQLSMLYSLFGEPVHQIRLRRVVPCQSPQCINFHTDVSHKTMQVPLNQLGECNGGQLIYATRDGLICPSRKPGSCTIHDNTIPHGVSQHVAGIRYGLFLFNLDCAADSA